MDLEELDNKIVNVMNKYGLSCLRYSLAIVFVWFGILKPFGLSPAAELVAMTVTWIPAEIFLPVLGVWEVLIGIFFLFKKTIRAAIFLMALQMAGTFLPLILLPEIVYVRFPYALTLEGQYIIKNIVLISAAIVIGSHVRDK
jgi:uncharacterized membrane protein YkgB